MKNELVTVIGTGPHTFHGAGISKHRILHALHTRGYDTHFVGMGRPYFFKQFRGPSFNVHVVDTPPSEAYRECGKLFWSTYAIAEKVADLAVSEMERGQSVLLWGTYLYPYVQSLCIANEYIAQNGHARAPLLSFPAGSDIWESGRFVKRSVRLLLDSPHITARATYSGRFSREIQRRFDVHATISVLPPLVDRSQFRVQSRRERAAAQVRAGVAPGTVVVVHHSNLRPVKRVQDTLELVERAAGYVRREVLLVVVGPIDAATQCAPERYALFGISLPSRQRGTMTTVFAGLTGDVRPYLEIADVAVNTSVHDSFNVSLLEAVWSGVPCVTSRAPAMSDYLKAGRCAVFLEYRPGMRFLDVGALIALEQSPFDLEKGARDLAALLYDEPARDRLARLAEAFMTQHLDPDEIVDRYESLIRTLVRQ